LEDKTKDPSCFEIREYLETLLVLSVSTVLKETKETRPSV